MSQHSKHTRAPKFNLPGPTDHEIEPEPEQKQPGTLDDAPARPPAAASVEDDSAAPGESSTPAAGATAPQPPASTGASRAQSARRGKRGKDRSSRLQGLLAEVPYQLTDEYPGKKRKKVWGLICPSLDEDLDEAHDLWNMLNPQWRSTHGGGAPPTKAAFREAVLRLGLKHLNDDEEFADLIPRDQRRTPGRDAELELDE